jgi:hypothetical protein
VNEVYQVGKIQHKINLSPYSREEKEKRPRRPVLHYVVCHQHEKGNSADLQICFKIAKAFPEAGRQSHR